MYCYHCMNEIPGGGFCTHCGAPTTPETVTHHLVPGTVLCNKYVVGNSLGEGGFGITYIGRDLNLDVRVAIKEYYPVGYAGRNNTLNNEITPSSDKQRDVFEKGKQRFLQEARSLARFSNEKGVVLVRDYFEACGTAYIVMEYLDGITLQEYLRQHKTIEADKVFRMMLPIITSLEHIHKEGIIHRDISPDNIMYMHDGSLKLMDFGSARFFTNGEKEMSVLVKQGYAPEEQYRRNGAQGPWTDVYALCATIYKCITGVVPDDSLNRLHVDTLKPPSALGVRISPQLEGVLMYGLAVYQQQRCKDMAQLKALVSDALEGRGSQTQLHTDSFITRPVDDPDSPPPVIPPVPEEREPEPKKKSALPVVLTVLIVLLLVGIGVMVYFLVTSGGDDNTDPASVAETEATEQKEQADETQAEEAAAVKVPNVVGMDSAKAISTLSELGLVAKPLSVQDSSHDKDQVFEQSPKAKTEVEPGSEVVIYISEGKAETPATEKPTKAPSKSVGDSGNSLQGSGSASNFTEPHSSGDTLYCRASDTATLRDIESRFGKALATIKSGQSVTYLDTVNDFYKVRYNGQDGYVLAEYFSGDANSSLVGGDGVFVNGSILFCVASDYLTLREGPSTSAAKITTIYPREMVRFIKDDEGDSRFAKITYKGQTGYVLGKFLSDYKYAELITDSQ